MNGVKLLMLQPRYQLCTTTRKRGYFVTWTG